MLTKSVDSRGSHLAAAALISRKIRAVIQSVWEFSFIDRCVVEFECMPLRAYDLETNCQLSREGCIFAEFLFVWPWNRDGKFWPLLPLPSGCVGPIFSGCPISLIYVTLTRSRRDLRRGGSDGKIVVRRLHTTNGFRWFSRYRFWKAVGLLYSVEGILSDVKCLRVHGNFVIQINVKCWNKKFLNINFQLGHEK